MGVEDAHELVIVYSDQHDNCEEMPGRLHQKVRISIVSSLSA